jgi:hypothetical protein
VSEMAAYPAAFSTIIRTMPWRSRAGAI